MKSHALTALLLWVAFFSKAAVPAGPAGNEWENPQLTGMNKLAPAAPLWPFASQQEAMAVMPEACSFVKNLDGKWAFSWVNIPDKRPVDFITQISMPPDGTALPCRATGTCKVLEKTGLCATASPYTSIRKSYSGIR